MLKGDIQLVPPFSISQRVLFKSWSVLQRPSIIMVDTINIQQNMEQNTSKALMILTLPLLMAQEEAVEMMKKKILVKAMVKLCWLPLTATPDVTSPSQRC